MTRGITRRDLEDLARLHVAYQQNRTLYIGGLSFGLTSLVVNLLFLLTSRHTGARDDSTVISTINSRSCASRSRPPRSPDAEVPDEPRSRRAGRP
jgi:hypothetical protein